MLARSNFSDLIILVLALLENETYGYSMVKHIESLGLIGLILRQSFDNLFSITVPEKVMLWLKPTIIITLIIIALITTRELIRDIVRISRRKLNPARHD